MSDINLHSALIGQQGSRAELNTPVLVVDGDALKRNIDAMAAFARQHKIALRPHAKTHKSAHIAQMQIDAGAVGICCAKLGEAEALAQGGVGDVLITSPVVTPQAIGRLISLAARIKSLRVAVDNPLNVDALAAAASKADIVLQVIVDIDPGIRRTGVASPEAALDLAQRIAALPSLKYRGVQFYCGQQQHIESFADRRSAIEERTLYLSSVVALLEGEGLAPEFITGGGTGTHRIDASLGVFNELQTGSYVFMDRQYNECDITGEGGAGFETSLFIDTRIISANAQSMATLDSGFKSMSTDGGLPTIVDGAPTTSAFFFMGDEHAALIAPGHEFKLGDLVTLAVPHCDPTVNLYDAYHVVQGATLVDIWPVTARGRSR